MVFGIRSGLLSSPVTVSLPGGDATVAWDGASIIHDPAQNQEEFSSVYLTGSAENVFTGCIELED